MVSELDARRMRRVLEDGLSRIGDVMRSDVAASRQALAKLIRFTPLELPSGDRTYRFEGNLALGQIASFPPAEWRERPRRDLYFIIPEAPNPRDRETRCIGPGSERAGAIAGLSPRQPHVWIWIH